MSLDRFNGQPFCSSLGWQTWAGAQASPPPFLGSGLVGLATIALVGCALALCVSVLISCRLHLSWASRVQMKRGAFAAFFRTESRGDGGQP